MMRGRHLAGGIGKMAMILLMTAVAGCAWSNPTDTRATPVINTDRIVADLTPLIERLYLSWHELDQIYKDIKFLERGLLFDPDDRQMGYIQKASLYIQDASVRIRHQWDRLSVLHYIRPQMMRDYLTLSASGLASAIREIGYDENFLTIYGSFITLDAVNADLNRARHQIQKNVGELNQILEKLLPIANRAGPPTVL